MFNFILFFFYILTNILQFYLEFLHFLNDLLQSCGARNFDFKGKKISKPNECCHNWVWIETVVKSCLIRVLSTRYNCLHNVLPDRKCRRCLSEYCIRKPSEYFLDLIVGGCHRRRQNAEQFVILFIPVMHYDFICCLTNNLWFIIFLAKHQYKLFQMVSTPHKHTNSRFGLKKGRIVLKLKLKVIFLCPFFIKIWVA